MKLKQIAFAAAVLAGAPAAFALTPAQVDNNTLRLWLSGASAPTASIYKGVLTLCAGMKYKDGLGVAHTNPGTPNVHLYLEKIDAGKLPGGGSNFAAYTCTVDTDDERAGDLEGKKLVVFHTVDGGSFNYVGPHINIAGEGPMPNSLGVTYPVVNNNLTGKLGRISNIEGANIGAATKCADPAVAKTGVFYDGTSVVTKTNAAGAGEPAVIDLSGITNNVDVYRNCAITTQTFSPAQAISGRPATTSNPDRPEGGFSDTEYLMNKLNLNIATDIGAIGSEVGTNIGQVFGVAVSYPLYLQLQTRQGIIAANAACTGNYAAGACQPNMPASLYTTVANAASIGGVNPGMFGAAAFPGTSAKLQFHRRTITSGTQSASNLRFLNKPCATGEAQGAMEPARLADSTALVKVSEQSSTGSVKTGLTAASTAGEYGMGWLSAENIPVSGTDAWAFVKLDGVAPNADAKQRQTAMDGSYSAFYELVAFTAADASPEGSALVTAITGSLGNPGITDLPGLFITPLAGVVGAYDNVGKVYRAGNSCSPAAQ